MCILRLESFSFCISIKFDFEQFALNNFCKDVESVLTRMHLESVFWKIHPLIQVEKLFKVIKNILAMHFVFPEGIMHKIIEIWLCYNVYLSELFLIVICVKTSIIRFVRRRLTEWLPLFTIVLQCTYHAQYTSNSQLFHSIVLKLKGFIRHMRLFRTSDGYACMKHKP